MCCSFGSGQPLVASHRLPPTGTFGNPANPGTVLIDGLENARANRVSVEMGIHSDSDTRFPARTLENRSGQLVSHLVKLIELPINDNAEAAFRAVLFQTTRHQMCLRLIGRFDQAFSTSCVDLNTHLSVVGEEAAAEHQQGAKQNERYILHCDLPFLNLQEERASLLLS